ncbi:hypothetical protein ACFVQ0_36990 [Streptomyces sp. NPDC057900]|uniref:hypothetical protein n=1 Tax=Streptomyces sp. NPDC057900 TaxID=3346274 RepID=UPI0036ECD0F7
MSMLTVGDPDPTTPLGNPPAWDVVIRRADGECECTGSCGRTHAKTGRRCDRRHDHNGTRLLIAPVDLSGTPGQQAQAPRDQLRAWCPSCYRLASKRHTEDAAHRTRDTTEALFDL